MRDKHEKSHHSFVDNYCLYVEHRICGIFPQSVSFENLQNDHLKKNELREKKKKQLIHTDSVYKFICVLLTIFKVKQFWCLNFKYFSTCPRFCVLLVSVFVCVIQLHKNKKTTTLFEHNSTIIFYWYVLVCCSVFFFLFCCFMLIHKTRMWPYGYAIIFLNFVYLSLARSLDVFIS